MKKEKKIKIKGEGKKGRKERKGEKVPENTGVFADAPCGKEEEFVPLTGALMIYFLLQVNFNEGRGNAISNWGPDDKRAFQTLLHFDLIRPRGGTNITNKEEKDMGIHDFCLTEKGKVFLFKGLEKVPFPVLKWEIPPPIEF